MQPIALVQRDDRTLVLDDDPALFLLGVLCGSAMLPLVMVSATAPLVQGWFALIGHSPVQRSLLPLRREQRGKSAGPSDLSIRDRAEPWLDHTKRSLEDRFSHPGGSGHGLRSGGVAIKPIATGVDAATDDDQPVKQTSPTLATWRGGSRWCSYRQAGSWV